MPILCTSGLVSMSLLVLLTAARATADDAGESRSLGSLFDSSRHATGREYTDARDALLSAGPAAVALLEARAQAADLGAEDRWLAAILLDRAQHPGEFARLEEVFAAEVWTAEFGGPRITASGRFPKGLLFPPGQKPPNGFSRPGQPGPFDGEFQRWRAAMQLQESSLWGSLLGEILLKGWTGPDGPDAGKAGRGRGLPTPDAFLLQAIHLLGRMGETRAGGHLLKILRAENRPDPTRREDTYLGIRVQAAEALGRLKDAEALDTLLELAEDLKTPDAMVAALYPAIRRIGDPRAFPALERIAARPFAPNDGKTFNFNAINSGTAFAAQTLRYMRGAEKAPAD